MRPFHIALVLGTIISFSAAREAPAMTIEIAGSEVIMSGKVTGDECDRLRATLNQQTITTIILSDSIGGDANAGYCTGELIRERRLNTVIKGYCISSCSRMWLGGVQRRLDGPNARVGLHGHYTNGVLNEMAPPRLREWLVRFAPVDKTLMEQWINLPYNYQVMYFFNDRASLCEKRQCTRIEGQNVFKAGLAE